MDYICYVYVTYVTNGAVAPRASQACLLRFSPLTDVNEWPNNEDIKSSPEHICSR